MEEGNAYKLPKSKMPMTATFNDNCICNLYIVGIGTHKIVTSINRAAIPLPKKNAGTLMQTPTDVGSV